VVENQSLNTTDKKEGTQSRVNKGGGRVLDEYEVEEIKITVLRKRKRRKKESIVLVETSLTRSQIRMTGAKNPSKKQKWKKTAGTRERAGLRE